MNVIPRWLLVLFLLVAPFQNISTAESQSNSALIVSAPVTDSFPVISLNMDAYDEQGSFLDDLTVEDTRITEDGQAVKPAALEKIPNGLQVIVALNTSPTMITKKNGVTGYQQVQNALVSWAEQIPASSRDDISLSTPTGLFLIREKDPAKIIKGINEYQPDLVKLQPSLGSLAEALDLATDPLGQPQMKRAILYITPPLPASAGETINDLTSRAKEIGVRVHVWMIVQTAGNAAAANPLQTMAASTGGQFQEMLIADPLPEIEPLLKPLRQTYQLSYTSKIQKGGSHKITVQVTKGSAELSSNEVGFRLDVQPPSPIFLSPPASVERKRSTTEGKTGDSALTPADIPLQILIEFPDQHRRPLKATRLFVNGSLASENTSEPFDHFNWSISALDTAGRQMLRVEAEDMLGMTGASPEIPVEIVIEQPAKARVGEHLSSSGMIAIGAILAAGIVLALVLTLTTTKRRWRRSLQNGDRKLQKDPVTQPVKIRQEASKPKKDKSTPVRGTNSWPVWPHQAASSLARLIILDENEEPVTGGTVSLNRQEITFGSDPQKATHLLDSSTVSGLHARLYRSEDEQFYLADQGSVAGTWINYAPVTSAGARLEHGDLIHIGKVMFRFELAEPGKIPTVEVQVLDQEQ